MGMHFHRMQIPLFACGPRNCALQPLIGCSRYSRFESASHVPGAEQDMKIANSAARFGIDVAAAPTGWGYAIDALYDGLAKDLDAIADMLIPT